MNYRSAKIAVLIVSSHAYAVDFNACAKGKLENGGDCQSVQAIIDLTSCGSGLKEKTVKATCWNGKRVAKTQIGKYSLTATFESQSGWGQSNWSLAGISAFENKEVKKEVAKSIATSVADKPAETAAIGTSPSAREPAGIVMPPQPVPPAPTKVDESLKISGLLDLNYTYNFNSPRPVTAPTSTAPAQPSGNNTYRIFDQYHDDINVNLAEVNFTKTSGDVTGYVALDFGTVPDVISPNDEAGKHLTEAKITYKPSEVPGLNLTAGKMMTHLGLEVTKAKDNWNYSRSLLFGWAIPFWHEGLAVNYPLNGKIGVTGYVYNKTNGAYQNNRSKSYGAQLSTAPIENFSLVYNFLEGREADAAGAADTRTLHEINGVYSFNDNLSLGFDVVKGKLKETGDWFAWSLAARWKHGRYSLSPRFEVFEDPDDAVFAAGYGQRLMSETLTFGADVGGGLELRLEFRQDESDKDSFIKGNDAAPVDHQFTSTLGLLYNF